MKTITIGDVHGESYWKSVNPENYDYVVFVGDYMDSFFLKPVEILSNLKEIIELKLNHKDKVILLLGNHDVPYYWGKPENISGFNIGSLWDYHDVFYKNKELFQVSFQIKNYIWTHAGIHKGWYDKYIVDAVKKYEINGDLSHQLNILFESNFKYLYNVSHHRGGTNKEGGIFWADFIELYKKPLNGYHQIFGHTIHKKIKTYVKNENTSITCVDVGKEEFYELEIN